jgi:hypothetical protein
MHSKNNTPKRPGNRLVTHADERFSVRINGRWHRRISALSSQQYLALLRNDRERLVLHEFQTGMSCTGSRVIVARPATKETYATA